MTLRLPAFYPFFLLSMFRTLFVTLPDPHAVKWARVTERQRGTAWPFTGQAQEVGPWPTGPGEPQKSLCVLVAKTHAT